MTENDAKKLVCPFMVCKTIKVNSTVKVTYNKKCCASECMAWNICGYCMLIKQGK